MCIDEEKLNECLYVLKGFRKVNLNQVRDLDKIPVVVYKQCSSILHITTTFTLRFPLMH